MNGFYALPGNRAGHERQPDFAGWKAHRGGNACVCAGFQPRVWDFCGGYDVALSVFLIYQGFLCAEDNALNAEILEAVLDMNGATCVIYPDGQKLVDTFAFVKPGEFDAILMDVQNCLNAGMDAHISKPLDIGVLERTLKSVAGGKAAGGGQVVHR